MAIFTAVLAQEMIVVLPLAWGIILLMLFLVFWPDGTGVVDGTTRQFANIIWNRYPKVHERFKGDIRPIYYGLLSIFTVIWIIAILTGTPLLTMVLIEGSLANIGGVIFAVGLLAVNYKLLPKEFRFSSFEVVISAI